MDASLLVIRKNTFKKNSSFNYNFICFNFDFNETKKILNGLSANCISDFNILKVTKSPKTFKRISNWVNKLKYIRVFQPEYSCAAPWENNKIIENNINLIIIFNFHKLKMYENSFSTGFFHYNKRISKKILKNLYEPYIKKLIYIEKRYNLKFLQTSNENKNFLLKLIVWLKIFLYADNYKFIK